MAKARITVVGAGLMGHGIAQVFALAGHDVTIYDSFEKTLATAKDRIRTNLKDLGDDESAVERVTAVADLGAALRPISKSSFKTVSSASRPAKVSAHGARSNRRSCGRRLSSI